MRVRHGIFRNMRSTYENKFGISLQHIFSTFLQYDERVFTFYIISQILQKQFGDK